jgi:hypothetical protein
MDFQLPDILGTLYGWFQDLFDVLRNGFEWVVQSLLDGIVVIIDGFLAGLLAGVDFLMDMFPEVAPLGLNSQSGILIGYAWLNSWLPVGETLTALTAIVGVASVVFAARAAYMAWKALPLT